MIIETKTQKKLFDEYNKTWFAYTGMTKKERQAFYNIVRGQVTKQRNALEKIAEGKVSKRYSILKGEKSPALVALERREGIVGRMPDKMPDTLEEYQNQMETARRFLTAETATAKNWLNYLKHAKERTEIIMNRKLTLEEGREVWELIKKLESTEGGGMYDASLSSEEGYRQVVEKVFDPKLTIDQMMNKWEEYIKNKTPKTIDDDDLDVFSLARKQRQSKQTNNYFKQDKYVEDSNIKTQVRKNKRR